MLYINMILYNGKPIDLIRDIFNFICKNIYYNFNKNIVGHINVNLYQPLSEKIAPAIFLTRNEYILTLISPIHITKIIYIHLYTK